MTLKCRSQLLAAQRSSRKKRGVNVDPEPSIQQPANDDQDNDPSDEAQEDVTQPGQVLLTARGRIWTPRAPTSIPAAPETHAAKKVLKPDGSANWKEVPFSRKSRMPNTVLGALLRYHYPQKVYDKTSRPPADVPATKWQHWYMKGELGDTMADRVKNDFKARYKWPDNEPEQQTKFEKTLENCCNKLARQQVYNARIFAVQAFYAEEKHEAITFKAAKTKYLEAREYERVPFSWINTDAWISLSSRWASDAFISNSKLKRAARLSRPESVHHGGSCSVTRTCQQMEEKYGRPFGVLEGYAIHAGASREEVANLENKDMPEIANTRAQEYMEQYRDAMIERNGEDVDWLHGPFDPQVMYESTGGKPHGRFAIGDGAFDSESVRLNCSAGDTSEFHRAKRQREENDFDQRLQDREREFVERMKQREMEIITQVREEARQEIQRANQESDARHQRQMREMFSYFQLCQGNTFPLVPPFSWNNSLSNPSNPYQVHQNSNEATIQRTGDSSFGYRQAERNIANDGIQPPTRGTSGTGNENMGENVHGSAETTLETNGHVDSFLELLRSTPQ